MVPYDNTIYQRDEETPMKEFVTAFEEVAAEDDREARIATMMADGKTREQAEAELGDPDYIEFKVDDRILRAFHPNDGQLTFMLAALGRGQSQESRFASIINIMLSCLRDEDADYLEGRLLSNDPKKRLPVKQIEAIFEYLTEEWFARPTQSPSDSAPSPQSDGQK